MKGSTAVLSLVVAAFASVTTSGYAKSAELTVDSGSSLPAQRAISSTSLASTSLASTSLASTSFASPSLQNPEPHLAIASQSEQSRTVLEDGVYLYGQSPDPGQLGSAYLVFEVSSSDVVGAFYMPHSSFDCFQGEFQENRLALQITDSYEQVTFPYAIALDQDAVLASSGDLPATDIGLAGFHQVEFVSANDHRILNVCKA
ncbi:MAG: hypothetical protein AAF327_08410, partial [Cyanobacteria bacterium P01_A01_bin.37]